METRKALLTIIVILAFALIAVSVSQLTGFSVNEPTTVVASPASVLPGDEITITVYPGEAIKNEVTIYQVPSMTRLETIKLEGCDGYKCNKGSVGSARYLTSNTEQSTDYIVKAFDLDGNEVGSSRYTVI